MRKDVHSVAKAIDFSNLSVQGFWLKMPLGISRLKRNIISKQLSHRIETKNVRLLMPKLIPDLLAVIFLDNFYLTIGLWLTLLASLTTRRFFHFEFSYFLAICSWVFLIVTASVVGAILLIDLFSQQKGMDRLTLVPYILGVSPLFISAILAAFMLPKNS
jgi:hypothetical protein